VAINTVGMDNGSCGDALTPACALALKDLVSTIVKTEIALGGTFTCDSLEQKLSESTPAACTLHPNLWVNTSSKSGQNFPFLIKKEQHD
jgi:hypothetical protein